MKLSYVESAGKLNAYNLTFVSITKRDKFKVVTCVRIGKLTLGFRVTATLLANNSLRERDDVEIERSLQDIRFRDVLHLKSLVKPLNK